MTLDLKIGNGITEAEFLTRFPDPYCVRALTPWEAHRRGLDHRCQYWEFVSKFRFLSKFGWITIPAGFVTDFASIPGPARGIIDDDKPTILFGSGPHDRLFAVPFTDDGRELTFRECNEVLAEAMWFCGSCKAERSVVFACVQTGGRPIWNRLRREN